MKRMRRHDDVRDSSRKVSVVFLSFHLLQSSSQDL